MHEYQISKYDPQYRRNGKYTRDEWSGESDIGKIFAYGILSREEYDTTLDRYIGCTIDILKCDHVEQMTISDLEVYTNDVIWRENQVINIEELNRVIHDCLHEKCWCRLSAGGRFVHFGYELYMYIGCNMGYEDLAAICTQYGMFVIERESPYKDEMCYNS